MAKNETHKTSKVAADNANIVAIEPKATIGLEPAPSKAVTAKPTIVAATKTAVTETVAAVTKAAVTKAVAAAKPKRADRDSCKAARTEIHALDTITTTDKVNNARQGSLRYNIVEAIRTSPRVKEACSQEVYGAAGTKHATTPYRVKLVDVGFAAGNGFITTSKPE